MCNWALRWLKLRRAGMGSNLLPASGCLPTVIQVRRARAAAEPFLAKGQALGGHVGAGEKSMDSQPGTLDGLEFHEVHPPVIQILPTRVLDTRAVGIWAIPVAFESDRFRTRVQSRTTKSAVRTRSPEPTGDTESNSTRSCRAASWRGTTGMTYCGSLLIDRSGSERRRLWFLGRCRGSCRRRSDLTTDRTR
jgi:hypothetical protein